MSNKRKIRRRTKAEMNYPKYKIDDIFSIELDAYNIMPKKLTEGKKGKPTSLVLGYCSSFRYACMLLKDHGCTSDLSNISDIRVVHVDGKIKIVEKELQHA